MLSYRHGYHAGGWADVHKHVAFTLLLSHLRQKPAPFTVVDAFAGDAVYDLTGAEAAKTREFETGIARIWDETATPRGVAEYLALIHSYNSGPALRTYPGSPALARACLRGDDRLILNELHPTAHRALADWSAHDHRIALHKREATELLGAVVTPQLRRGLVFVDPAYEVKSEYAAVAAAVARAARTWPQGIYAIWYPVLDEARHRSLLAFLHTNLAGAIGKETIVAEIAPPLRQAPARGMRGAGLVIINQPWRFDDELRAAGDWLAGRLWSPEAGRHHLCPLPDYPGLGGEPTISSY